MILLIDVLRNKCVGCFKNIKEAMAYAKEEGIQTVTVETVKEART
jgi:hypothetical protein